MARKHLLTNIGTASPHSTPDGVPSGSRVEYARRGASRSMMQSLDEMAENSMRILDGETIVALDPHLLDGSIFADRIGDDEDEFRTLVSAIAQSGQSSPILVRPHPDQAGRYMIVYGHRRARAAKELGINVRAVIKPLEDIAHVIAQGQENTARANLTFIEKALFARKLAASGMSKDTIKTALTVDDTLLSRMLAVAEQVPEVVLDAIGAAKGIGRDRWEELKKLLQFPEKSAQAIHFIQTRQLDEVSQEQRFAVLLEALSKSPKRKPPKAKPAERAWGIADQSVKVATKDSGKAFTLALTSKDASSFGAYLSKRLEQIYREFQQSETEQKRD